MAIALAGLPYRGWVLGHYGGREEDTDGDDAADHGRGGRGQTQLAPQTLSGSG